jgi:hypothetical protein
MTCVPVTWSLPEMASEFAPNAAPAGPRNTAPGEPKVAIVSDGPAPIVTVKLMQLLESAFPPPIATPFSENLTVEPGWKPQT